MFPITVDTKCDFSVDIPVNKFDSLRKKVLVCSLSSITVQLKLPGALKLRAVK